MTKKITKKQQLKLSAITTASKNWDDASIKSSNGMQNLLDLIIPEGAKVGFNLAVAKEGRTAIYSPLCEAIREGVVLNRSKNDKRYYALYHANVADLSKEKGTGTFKGCKTEQQDKKYVVQQIGSRVSKVNDALKTRLEGGKKGANKRVDDKTACQEKITWLTKRAKKSDTLKCDVVEFLAKLDELQKILNTKA